MEILGYIVEQRSKFRDEADNDTRSRGNIKFLKKGDGIIFSINTLQI